ncbi:LamG-like jellyroll fold domain-containing protein [Leifsonia sp. RAF41]|uniref:LamG-like jellyroll fold domain-containing protein n=1 Tax=Leifsonia sp. RAF41 TaxID=3233056 RepID=UPI003F9968CB
MSSWSSLRACFLAVAVGLSLCVAASALVAAPVAVALPAGAAERGPVVADSEHAASESEARAIAVAHDHDVVVDDQSTPTLLVRAKPGGQMEAVSSQLPEQARIGGSWKPVDSVLVEHDQWWEPKVAVVPVRIGKGGTSDIVSVQAESGDWITETWPYGTLPKPTIRKDAAVFPAVLPDVDLRVQATKAGMREVLIVKTAAAASDSRVAELRLGLRGAEIRLKAETGTLEAHTTSGDPVVAATPLWWDSSESEADEEGAGGGEPRAVETRVDGAETVMSVGAVAEGDPTYPLYIDPDWSAYLQYDWFTDRAYPNQSYLNPPENSVGYGIQNGIAYMSRAFYRFETGFLAGKIVSNARFNVVQNWANSCASTWTQLWQYGPSAVGFTWNSDPAQWVRAIDAQSYNTGGPCSPNPAWVGFNATPTAQDAAIYSAPYVTLALRTADEGNALSRKHFRWDAQLVVTYNSRPNVPTGASMISPNRGCSTDPNNPSYVYGKQPIALQVAASDPDPGNVAANFYLTNTTTGIEQLLSTTALQAQGAALQHTIPASTLPDGQKYAWSALASDYMNVSGRTAPCYFVVDSTKPGLPTAAVLSAADLVDGDPSNIQVDSRVGEAISVRVTPPAGDAIGGYMVWWTAGARTEASPSPSSTDYTTALPICGAQGAAERVECADATGRLDIEVAPIAPLATLWVSAYDRAGNVSFDAATRSAATGLSVRSGKADLLAGHAWLPVEPSDVIDDSVNSVGLTVGSISGWGEDEGEDPQLKTDALVSLNRFLKPGISHWTDSGAAGTPAGHVLEWTIGQLARVASGSPAPKDTAALYSCLHGPGNMLSLSQNCEGTGAAARLLGYVWTTRSAAPSGYDVREIFRCRVGTDYFVSTLSTCEGQIFEGSRGFVLVHSPTKTTESVVDTTKSFTVSARVKPATIQGIQTVAATTSSQDSGFYLQANGDAWRFCMRSQGTTKVTPCVNGARVDTVNYATITGTWDAVNKRLSIAVFSGEKLDVSSSQISLPADNVSSTGVLTVGSATSQGYPSDFFGGSIADVSIYPGLIPDAALRRLPVPLP